MWMGLTGAIAAAHGANVMLADAAQPALLFAQLNTWPWRKHVTVRKFDWNEDRLDCPPFELIVGADILYDQGDWNTLLSMWDQYLAPHGEVLLGEPGRSTGKGFLDHIDRKQWTVNVSAHRSKSAETIRVISLLKA